MKLEGNEGTFDDESKPCHMPFFSFSFGEVGGEVGGSLTAASLRSGSDRDEGRLVLTPKEESSEFATTAAANMSAEDAPMLGS